MPVSGEQGVPDRDGDGAGGATDVEDLTAGAEDDGDDLGVAGQPAQEAGWEAEPVPGDRQALAQRR